MYSIQNKQHKRSISQNHNYGYTNSKHTDQDNNDSFSNRLETQQHEEILKERARRFVARMRKQREYAGGKYILKKQAEERRRQEEQKLMQSLMLEKEQIQKSIKMTVALQKILINECKKEKKLIKQLSQQLKTSHQESSDQESKSRYEGQTRPIDKQIGSAKRFKTFQSEKTLQMQRSSKISILPQIAVPNQPRQAENNAFRYFKPLTKPKQDRQIYLNKLDQMKLKSIDSKMRKLSKLTHEILYQQT